jgi:hypothetical protein
LRRIIVDLQQLEHRHKDGLANIDKEALRRRACAIVTSQFFFPKFGINFFIILIELFVFGEISLRFETF